MKTKITIFILLCLAGLTIKAQVPQFLGMTSSGGSDQAGTIFKINGDGSGYQLVRSMPWNNDGMPYGSLIKGNDGNFYGMTEGTSCCPGALFRLNPITYNYTALINVGTLGLTHPEGSLMQATNGKLYGMGPYGINNLQYAAIFRYDLNTQNYTILHTCDNTTGKIPLGNLFEASNGKLYGIMALGGSNNLGIIFSLDTSTNAFLAVHNFDSASGYYNNSVSGNVSLIQASNGLLYGMTKSGGTNHGGVIFSFDINTNTYTVLYNFQTTTGINPNGRLLLASDGNLYGLTTAGGANNNGVVFKFNTSTYAYTDVFDFNGTSTGGAPNGSLIQASDGKLYGTTYGGGTNNTGIVFKYDYTSNVCSVVYNFSAVNSATSWRPLSDLLEISSSSSCSANFTMAPDTILHHYIATNLATGTGPLHYYWSWGDNTYDTSAYPSHTYADTGYYNICLTIMDASNCSSIYCDNAFHALRTTNTMVYVNVIAPVITGTNEHSSNLINITIYPNPAKNTINIHQSSTSPNEQLIITDILGHEVYKAPLTGIDNTIELTKWSSGVYFYEVKGSGLQIPTSIRGKFIKQ